MAAYGIALLLAAIFLLPGVLAAAGRGLIGHRCGVVIVAALSWLPLPLLEAHHAPVWLGPVCAGALSVAARFAVFSRYRQRPRRLWARLAPWAVLAVVALAVWLQWNTTWQRVMPRGIVPWYYADLATQVVRVGGFPSVSREWGLEVPFLLDYPYFTALTAGAFRMLGEDMDLALRIVSVRLAYTLLLAWVGAEAFRATVGRDVGVVGFALLLGTEAVFMKMLGYRPEVFGYLLLFAGLWWARTELWPAEERPQRIRAALVLAGLFAVLLLTHGVSASLALAGLAAGAWAYGRVRGELAIVFLSTAAAVLSGVLFYAVLDVAITGDLTQVTNASANAASSNAGIVDPSWEFYRELVDPYHRQSGERLRAREFSAIADRLRMGTGGGLWPFVALTSVSLVLLMVTRGQRWVAGWGCWWIVALAAGGLVFLAGWDTYVPQRVGPRRIWPFVVFPAALLWAGAAAELERLTGQRWRRAAGTSWVPLLILASALTATHYGGRHHRRIMIPRLPRHEYTFLTKLKVGPGDRVITNGFNEGTLAAITGAEVITGGVAPFNKRAIVDHSIDTLRNTRALFNRPTRKKACEMGADYLVVSRSWVYAGVRWVRGVNWRQLRRHFRRVKKSRRKGGVEVYATDCDRPLNLKLGSKPKPKKKKKGKGTGKGKAGAKGQRAKAGARKPAAGRGVGDGRRREPPRNGARKGPGPAVPATPIAQPRRDVAEPTEAGDADSEIELDGADDGTTGAPTDGGGL